MWMFIGPCSEFHRKQHLTTHNERLPRPAVRFAVDKRAAAAGDLTEYGGGRAKLECDDVRRKIAFPFKRCGTSTRHSRADSGEWCFLSIAVFTLASALCGMATSLGQLIVFRVLQGLAGGGLQPSSQGVLLDAFPPEKQGIAMTLFGFAALLAPIVGPTLGAG
jgi:Major Facilitator Superfamily